MVWIFVILYIFVSVTEWENRKLVQNDKNVNPRNKMKILKDMMRFTSLYRKRLIKLETFYHKRLKMQDIYVFLYISIWFISFLNIIYLSLVDILYRPTSKNGSMDGKDLYGPLSPLIKQAFLSYLLLGFRPNWSNTNMKKTRSSLIVRYFRWMCL